jgi:hypothetical protein
MLIELAQGGAKLLLQAADFQFVPFQARLSLYVWQVCGEKLACPGRSLAVLVRGSAVWICGVV